MRKTKEIAASLLLMAALVIVSYEFVTLLPQSRKQTDKRRAANSYVVTMKSVLSQAPGFQHVDLYNDKGDIFVMGYVESAETRRVLRRTILVSSPPGMVVSQVRIGAEFPAEKQRPEVWVAQRPE